MTARELELKWMSRVKQSGSLLLLHADDALALLDDCKKADVKFLGVEAFRMFGEGGVQPAMKYSNISFGEVIMKPDGPEVVHLKRGPCIPWDREIDFLELSKQLIRDGARNGFEWYEVSLEDPETGVLLFFREQNG